MAQFTNQARLTYSNKTVNSNIAIGEILEVLSISKTALKSTYSRNDRRITYVLSAVNSGDMPLNSVTVTDDLGAYEFGERTVTPEGYVEDTVRLFINGLLQASPITTIGLNGSVLFSGINLPGNSNMVLIYEAEINDFAPLNETGNIVNTATVSGNGIITPISASVTVTTDTLPELTITKSIEPVPVSENGLLTYRFVIQNYGNVDADQDDAVILTDTFDPALSNISVSFDGSMWTEGVQYNYNRATGVFETRAGQITVPASQFFQDEFTGEWVSSPGSVALIVSGNI